MEPNSPLGFTLLLEMFTYPRKKKEEVEKILGKTLGKEIILNLLAQSYLPLASWISTYATATKIYTRSTPRCHWIYAYATATNPSFYLQNLMQDHLPQLNSLTAELQCAVLGAVDGMGLSQPFIGSSTNLV